MKIKKNRLFILAGMLLFCSELKGNSRSFFDAAVHGDLGAVVEEIKLNPSVVNDKVESRTALFGAAGWGQYEVVKVLVESGANVKESDKTGKTPLHMTAIRAVSHGNDEKTLSRIAELLLDHGALVDAPDEHGITPLQCAINSGRIQLVKLFIAHGADVNLKNKLGWSSLNYAESAGNDTMIQLLKDHGAK